jgi:general secretion pathway protein I
MSRQHSKKAASLLGAATCPIGRPVETQKFRDNTSISALRSARPSERDLFDASARGFSLIEMLVALVVLSLSLSVLYQAAMGATRNVRVASEYTDAVMLAESMLAEHSHVTEENFSVTGRYAQFDWQVSSWPARVEDGLDPEQRPVAPRALQYLEVVVSWPGRSAPRNLNLLTVVPLRELAE